MNSNHITIMKINHNNRVGKNAFTLIELLTVMSIIAILGGVGFPAIQAALLKGKMAAATANARSIGLSLRTYATDNEGLFPSGENVYDEEITTSNDAFRSLIPDYVSDERIFTVPRSAWGREADNRFEEPAEILEGGENHYAYIAGLTDTSRPGFPLVVDGTDGNGTYVEEQGSKGGCWDGRKAVVAFVGGHAKLVNLEGRGSDARFIPRDGYDEENALDTEYMGGNVRLLDPAEG